MVTLTLSTGCRPSDQDSTVNVAKPAATRHVPVARPRPTLRPELVKALETSTQTVLVSLPGAADDSRMMSLAAALNRTALPFGLDLRFHYASGDASQQEALLREMANRDARALLLWSLPDSGLIEAASELTAAGYPVISLVYPLPLKGIAVHVGTPEDTQWRTVVAQVTGGDFQGVLLPDCGVTQPAEDVVHEFQNAGVKVLRTDCAGILPSGESVTPGKWAVVSLPGGDAAALKTVIVLADRDCTSTVYRMMPTDSFPSAVESVEVVDILPNLDETGRRAIQVLLDSLAGKDTPALARIDSMQSQIR